MLFAIILLLHAYFQSFLIFLFLLFDTFNRPETCTIDFCGRVTSIVSLPPEVSLLRDPYD